MENTSKEDCVFCRILAGELESSMVYQDKICSAFMDIQPVNPGHVLIIPNEHVPYVRTLEENTATHMFRIAQRIFAAVRESGVKCEGINLFLADGEVAGQEVFHVHLHVFPRFADDGFGLQFGTDYEIEKDRGKLDEIAVKIKSKLII